MSARQGEQKAQNSIIITMPAAANVQELHVEPGGSIRFGFDASTADFAREGTALLIRQQDGGTIRLTDYFIIGEEAAAAGKGAKALPDFVLPDGTVIAGQDFLASMARDMDLSTAAGPSASAPSGGGSSYDDDAGSLLVGLDRFGSLGTDFWSRGSELSEIAQSRLMPEKERSFLPGKGHRGTDLFSPEKKGRGATLFRAERPHQPSQQSRQ